MIQSSWREFIREEAQRTGDDLTDLVVYPETTLWPRGWNYHPAEEATEQSTLDVVFHCGYGHSEGPRFTAWTVNRVYFPVVYDGSEWVASVPRNPCDEVTEHVGGQ